MKAHLHWLSLGRRGVIPCSLFITQLILGTPLHAEAPGNSPYHRGISAENALDLFGARRHFVDALDSKTQEPGMREHIAWFLYTNGFHDRQCLELLEQIKPTAQEPKAVAKAIRQLRGELGLAPPVVDGAVGDNLPAARGHGRAALLQRARQQFWSGALDDSISSYRELIGKMPAEAALRWELARVLVAGNSYDQAAAELAEARRLQPTVHEIIIAQANVEALRGHRAAALDLVDGLAFDDQAPVHLVRAKAHHYAGQFVPAADEYREVLASRPHHEMAAHGLAECSLRNNAVPEARDLLEAWNRSPRTIDWTSRFQLERELTGPRLRSGLSYFSNSNDYDAWSLGVDVQMRPRDNLDLGIAATHGWFDESGFRTIERNTANLSMRYQNSDAWALEGHAGVNDYDNDWTSLTGGVGVMIRPLSSLEINLSADHLDVVDSEPPMGVSLYDLASSIGAVGGRATMDSLTVSAIWQPSDRIECFAKYRMAELEGNNTLDDAYGSITWILSRTEPRLHVGYGIAYIAVEDPSPLYVEGPLTSAYYYDPVHLVVHDLFAELSSSVGDHVSYGSQVHVYLQPENDVTGFGLFGYLRYTFNERHALQLDARYYTQNHGRNRNGAPSGHYEALNLVATYEYHF